MHCIMIFLWTPFISGSYNNNNNRLTFFALDVLMLAVYTACVDVST